MTKVNGFLVTHRGVPLDLSADRQGLKIASTGPVAPQFEPVLLIKTPKYKMANGSHGGGTIRVPVAAGDSALVTMSKISAAVKEMTTNQYMMIGGGEGTTNGTVWPALVWPFVTAPGR